MRIISAALMLAALLAASYMEYRAVQGASVAVAISQAHQELMNIEGAVPREIVERLVLKAAISAAPRPGVTIAPCLMILAACSLFIRWRRLTTYSS